MIVSIMRRGMFPEHAMTVVVLLLLLVVVVVVVVVVAYHMILNPSS